MLEDKWAEKRDRWAWWILLESNGVWWWIMKMGRVRVKRLLVIKGDAVHCVDRPSHERISSFVASSKALLHWSLISPNGSWKIQVRPLEPRKPKFGPGLTVLIQRYIKENITQQSCNIKGDRTYLIWAICPVPLGYTLMVCLPFSFLNVNTSYMLCLTIGYVTGAFLSTILAYLQPRNQKWTFFLWAPCLSLCCLNQLSPMPPCKPYVSALKRKQCYLPCRL